MKQDVIIAVAKRWTDMSEWADVSVITPNGEIIEKKRIKSIDNFEYSYFDEENKSWDSIPPIKMRQDLLCVDDCEEEIDKINELISQMVVNHFQDKYNIIKVISV